MRTALYCIPTALGGTPGPVLPPSTLQVVRTLRDFVVENAKTARALLAASGIAVMTAPRSGADRLAHWQIAGLESLAAAAKGGRLLTCGATTGPDPQTDLGRIFWNQLTVYGSTMGTHAEFAEMLRIFRDGKVKPVVDAVFPLPKARDAEQRLEEKRQFGKIVIRVD